MAAAAATGDPGESGERSAVWVAFDAVTRFDMVALKRYVASGGELNVRSSGVSETLMHCAVRHFPEKSQYEPLTDLLIEHDRGLLDRADDNGNTPLHYAVQFCRFAVMKWLLVCGANIWARNSIGELPVQLSVKRTAERGDIDHEIALLSDALQLWTRGDNEDQAALAQEWRDEINAHKRTVLSALWREAEAAVHARDVAELQNAIDRGAPLNQSHDEQGRTLLMTACEYAHRAGVDLLLSLGADTNVQDSRGRNCVFYCVCANPTDDHVRALELVLDAGADAAVDDIASPAAARLAMQEAARADPSQPAQLMIRNGLPLQYAFAYCEAMAGKPTRAMQRMIDVLRAATEAALRQRPDYLRSAAGRTVKMLKMLSIFRSGMDVPLADTGPLVRSTATGEHTPLLLKRVIARAHAGMAADADEDEVDALLETLRATTTSRQAAVVRMLAMQEEEAQLKRTLRVRMRVRATVAQHGKAGILYVDKDGVIAFVGRTHFAPGLWVGVRLDEACGHHNGTLDGKRYFHAPTNTGVFVRPDRVHVSPLGADEPAPAAKGSAERRSRPAAALAKAMSALATASAPAPALSAALATATGRR